MQEITCDEKKKTMSAKMQAELSKLPGPKMFASLTGSASISGINLKKIENDVKDLLTAVSQDLGNEAQNGLEGKIDSL